MSQLSVYMGNKKSAKRETDPLESTYAESDGKHSAAPSGPTNTIGSTLGKVIRWTSNLIATGLVIAMVMTFGPELISSVLPSKTPINPDKLDIVEDWPTFQQCNLEFGDAGYQLSRSSFTGEIDDVFDLLESLCREQLVNDVKPFGTIGVQEKKFIEARNGTEPVESVPGTYRIFCERFRPMFAGFPTAIGIRDDCDHGSPSDSRQVERASRSRMAVWAMAMPAGEHQWTTFVGTSATEESSQWIDRLIPPEATKNLSLSDQLGGSVIGFVGGDLEEAIEFYRRFEQDHHCELRNIQRVETSWNSSVVLADGKKILEVRVQLTQPHGKALTGILMKKSSGKMADTSQSELTLREGNKYE